MSNITFLAKIRSAIAEHSLIEDNDHIGVGVSGGIDSMVLLDVLTKLQPEFENLQISVLHFEHGIRGQESEEDMSFVQEYCKAHSIPFYSRSASVPDYARENSLNLEEGARFLRYSFFNDCSKDYGISKVALAHHMDDNVETFLFNLIRGSGSFGLNHMEYRRELIIRPLLDVSREEIEEYAHENGIPFRTDSTNSSNEYSRNYIRNVVIPGLRKINPSVNRAVNSASKILSEEHQYIEENVSILFEELCTRKDQKLSFSIDKLNSFGDFLIKRILLKALYQLAPDLRNITERNLRDMLALVRNKETGKSLDLTGGIRVHTSYDLLIITTKMYKICSVQPVGIDDFLTVTGSFALKMEPAGKPDEYPGKNSLIQYIDRDKLPEDMVIRTRQDGDYIIPFGMTGSQKLKQRFIDMKMPQHDRDKQLLLCHGSEVLWIIGDIISNRLKITDDTENIIKITFEYRDSEDNG